MLDTDTDELANFLQDSLGPTIWYRHTDAPELAERVMVFGFTLPGEHVAGSVAYGVMESGRVGPTKTLDWDIWEANYRPKHLV